LQSNSNLEKLTLSVYFGGIVRQKKNGVFSFYTQYPIIIFSDSQFLLFLRDTIREIRIKLIDFIVLKWYFKIEKKEYLISRLGNRGRDSIFSEESPSSTGQSAG